MANNTKRLIMLGVVIALLLAAAGLLTCVRDGAPGGQADIADVSIGNGEGPGIGDSQGSENEGERVLDGSDLDPNKQASADTSNSVEQNLDATLSSDRTDDLDEASDESGIGDAA